jgi:hypothetical protein
MTNLEAWRLWSDKIPTTQFYKDWAWYFGLSAALQRRVYIGDELFPMFPNLFGILCDEPSKGKSVALDHIIMILKSVKVPSVAGFKDPNIFQEEGFSTGINKLVQAFPTSTQHVTLPALVAQISNTVRPYKDAKGALQLANTMLVYLDEITSMLNQDSAGIVDFLNETFMGRSYGKATQHSGSFYIKQPAITFIGNTTFEKLKGAQKTGVIGSGFFARTLMLHDPTPAYRTAFMKPKTPEQTAAREQLKKHFEKMAQIQGALTFTQDAVDFLNVWWADPQKVITNRDPMLSEYFGRKMLHLQKLAMCLHFEDNLDATLPITLATVQRAKAILEYAELTMHVPFEGLGRNQLAGVSTFIVRYVESQPDCLIPATKICDFEAQATMKELTEVMQVLLMRKKLYVGYKNTSTGQAEYYYSTRAFPNPGEADPNTTICHYNVSPQVAVA